MFTLTLTAVFTTIYERDIRIHTVVMPDGPGKVDYQTNQIKSVNNIFLPEIRTL